MMQRALGFKSYRVILATSIVNLDETRRKIFIHMLNIIVCYSMLALINARSFQIAKVPPLPRNQRGLVVTCSC